MPDVPATITPSPVPTTSGLVVAVNVPTVEGAIGAAGQELEVRVLGSDEHDILRVRTQDERPMRFELLGLGGVEVDHSLIDTIAARLRRSTDPQSLSTTLTPTEEDHNGGDGLSYSWRLDISSINAPGPWIVEFDVTMTGDVEVSWPNPGLQHIDASDGVN